MNRRNVLAGVGVTFTGPFVGCLQDEKGGGGNGMDGNADNVTEDDGSDRKKGKGSDGECYLETREEIGTAESIETTASVQLEDLSERDVNKRCAKEAAKTAFARLNDRLKLDLEGADWIHFGWRYDSDGYHAGVTVNSEKDSGEEGYHICPEPEFDYDTALAALPSEVTISLQINGGDGHHECTHEITLDQTVMYLD